MTNPAIRNADLWRMLSERRRELHNHIQRWIPRGTDRPFDESDSPADGEAGRDGEAGSGSLRSDLQTLALIDSAVGRLATGRYGWCADCHQEISYQRLWMLPLAECCEACAATREHQQLARHRAGLTAVSRLSRKLLRLVSSESWAPGPGDASHR